MKIDVRALVGCAGEQRRLDLIVAVPPVEGHGGNVAFAPASVRLVLTSTPEGILATGDVSAIAQLECGRCLVSFEHRAEGRLEHLFVVEAPASTGPGEREVRAGDVEEHEWSGTDTSEDEDLDMSPIQDGAIDIGPLVREVLDLALPMKPLCKDDCRGLCPVCGRSLNDGPCGCTIDEVDPRLAAFAEVLRAGATEHDSPADAGHPKVKKE